jgi:hypothetical protein
MPEKRWNSQDYPRLWWDFLMINDDWLFGLSAPRFD